MLQWLKAKTGGKNPRFDTVHQAPPKMITLETPGLTANRNVLNGQW